ncbi:hypothetical protein [Halomicronema sp. CCY15110]|uniref:hypothetical protein n=1 Tax=Halomicronema sp. CCY15110 TaxID=2767773 RepID=UPI0019516C4F|nr:hypothetical protein [Halomicronema sp. CCY15110]
MPANRLQTNGERFREGSSLQLAWSSGDRLVIRASAIAAQMCGVEGAIAHDYNPDDRTR